METNILTKTMIEKKRLEDKYKNNLYYLADKLDIVEPEEHTLSDLKMLISTKINILHCRGFV